MVAERAGSAGFGAAGRMSEALDTLATLRGVRLHVEQTGDGPPLLLAHGFAGSARNFRPQVRHLRERFRVWLYDAPGHARSEAPDDPEAYALEAFVEAFGRVAERAGPAPLVAGGLSLGATTALLYALRHPERVRALVLASPPPGRGAAGGVSARAVDMAEAIEREGLEAAGERFVWGPESGLDPQAREFVRRGFLEHPPHALAAALRRAVARLPSPADLAARLADLEIPALVLAGSEDEPSLAAAQQLAEFLPAARLEVVQRAGHVVNLADPRAFNAALDGFLAGPAVAGGPA